MDRSLLASCPRKQIKALRMEKEKHSGKGKDPERCGRAGVGWGGVGGRGGAEEVSGLAEKSGSEVEWSVGSEAFILLARGIWGVRAAEPPLLERNLQMLPELCI